MTQQLKTDYCVCEEIGRGRFGVVSRCVSLTSGDSFAVKSIDKRLVSDDSVDRQCLYNEPKALSLLSPNPNILRIFDVYEDESHLHIVTDLCSSRDLFQKLDDRRIFSESDAGEVMASLMEAIAHCHRHGVAHRDVKPDNVLFDENGCLKLADFGSAEWFKEGSPIAGVVGTPYYVAPEVLSGGNYDEKVDMWSAGVILYVMLAGFPPFYGEFAGDIFEAVLRANLRFPTSVFKSVSSAAKDLIRKMLCKDVSRRFSAEQVLQHPWIKESGDGRLMADAT